MATETIKEVLTTMIETHETLAAIAEEKLEVIKKGDMDALQSIINREEVSVRIIQQLEGQREKAVKAWAAAFADGSGEYRLSDVIKSVPEAEAEELSAIQNRLAGAVIALRDANDLNQQLLHQSMQWVQLNLNLMQPQTPSVNYGHPKKSQKKTAFQSRIDSRA
jgi:flagellar biosynthesis/type III secretory pathway chaperone